MNKNIIQLIQSGKHKVVSSFHQADANLTSDCLQEKKIKQKKKKNQAQEKKLSETPPFITCVVQPFLLSDGFYHI